MTLPAAILVAGPSWAWQGTPQQALKLSGWKPTRVLWGGCTTSVMQKCVEPKS